MAEKKNNCGCGCVPLKQNSCGCGCIPLKQHSEEPAKDERKAKESK